MTCWPQAPCHSPCWPYWLCFEKRHCFHIGSCISGSALYVWGHLQYLPQKPSLSLACSGFALLVILPVPVNTYLAAHFCRRHKSIDSALFNSGITVILLLACFGARTICAAKKGGTMKTVLLHGLGADRKEWAARTAFGRRLPRTFVLAQSGLSYPQILAGLENARDTAEPLRICGAFSGMLALDCAIRHGGKVSTC